MAVTEITEKWQGRGGNTNWKQERTYKRIFEVRTDNTQDSKVTVENALIGENIYQGSQYLTPNEIDVGAYVQSMDFSQSQEHPRLWTVTVNYDSKFDLMPGNRPDQVEKNPTLRVPQVRFGFVKATKSVTEDLNSNPVTNSADQPLQGGLQMEVNNPTITITLNKYIFNYPYVLSLQDCINNATWLGFPAKTVKVAGIDVNSQFENNYFYWQLVYTLEIKWDKWNPVKVLDQGFYQYDDNGNLVTIRDRQGTPLSAPALLDGTGHKTTVPNYREFKLYREIDFSGILSPSN